MLRLKLMRMVKAQMTRMKGFQGRRGDLQISMISEVLNKHEKLLID